VDTLTDIDLVRGLSFAPELERADDPAADDTGPLATVTIRFSPFNSWYRIDSLFEGRFLERTVKGSFKRTIDLNVKNMRVLFDHGYDPQIGNKPLGPIESLEEKSKGPEGKVPLMRTSYNADLLPGLEAGVYGSSFRFQVIKDEWNDEPGRSDYNPDGIPERTIKEVRLMEFGPVTFPANPAATAGVRSMTDELYERLRDRNPEQYEDLRSRAVALHRPASAMSTAEREALAGSTGTDSAARHSGGMSARERRALMFPFLRE
jgi:HK97 family phage prohead protease